MLPASSAAAEAVFNPSKGDAMQDLTNINVLFIAGFGPIVREAAESRKLYGQTFGIPFKEEKGGYLHTESLEGAKSFALWPLSEAAESCYGKDSWPRDVPVPQAWIERSFYRNIVAFAHWVQRGPGNG
jgi:hypothetical protein